MSAPLAEVLRAAALRERVEDIPIALATFDAPRRDPAPAAQLVRIDEVCLRTGLPRHAVYEGVARGTFPRQVKIGRASRWHLAEVEAWVRAHVLTERETEARDAIRHLLVQVWSRSDLARYLLDTEALAKLLSAHETLTRALLSSSGRVTRRPAGPSASDKRTASSSSRLIREHGLDVPGWDS